MIREQFILDIEHKAIVDLFAGGGGVSCAIEMALGRHVDVAANHDPEAIEMHKANHPQTRHLIADVYEIDPHEATQGRPVGLLHLSPDCTHHSQAAGGQPRDKRIRSLSWVGKRWAAQVAPDRISLENVKQISAWTRLVAKRCPKTGRVVKLDGSAAAAGERVRVQEQFLIPDRKTLGRTWKKFVRELEKLGYVVEWKTIIAADHGAGTSRERLFMMARRDGKPIVWPEATHAKNPIDGAKKWKPAADSIDFSIPCPSIFTRKKPLAPATMRRIAKGMDRFVLNNADPFIVPIAHYNGSEPVHSTAESMRTITAYPKGGAFALATPTLVNAARGAGSANGVKCWGDGAKDVRDPLGTITAGGGDFAVSSPLLVPLTHQGADRAHDIAEPMRTITGAHRGEIALAAPTLVKFRGDSPGSSVERPMPVITAGGGAKRPAGCPHALGVSAAFIAQANDGKNTTPGHDPRKPMSTITNRGSQQQLVAAHLAHLRGNCDARDLNDPLMTVSAGGEHHGLVEYQLSREDEEGALRVAAFLIQYYSEGGQWGDLRKPLATMTTRDRLALVTVWIKGDPWVIVDIGLRMLTPRELYNAQGFPPSYIIEYGADGRRFSKSAQVRMVGNSVSPPPAIALFRANCPDLMAWHFKERPLPIAA